MKLVTLKFALVFALLPEDVTGRLFAAANSRIRYLTTWTRHAAKADQYKSKDVLKFDQILGDEVSRNEGAANNPSTAKRNWAIQPQQMFTNSVLPQTGDALVFAV